MLGSTTIWQYYLDGVGETWFPLASRDLQAPETSPLSQREAYERAFASDPSRDGLRVKPQKGDAIMFYNFDASFDLDVHSLHAGLPAPSTKWIASQFFAFTDARAPREQGWWTKETVSVPSETVLPAVLLDHMRSG